MWPSGWLDLKVPPGVPTKKTPADTTRSRIAPVLQSALVLRGTISFQLPGLPYFQAVALGCDDMSDGSWWVYSPPALTLSRLKDYGSSQEKCRARIVQREPLGFVTAFYRRLIGCYFKWLAVYSAGSCRPSVAPGTPSRNASR